MKAPHANYKWVKNAQTSYVKYQCLWHKIEFPPSSRIPKKVSPLFLPWPHPGQNSFFYPTLYFWRCRKGMACLSSFKTAPCCFLCTCSHITGYAVSPSLFFKWKVTKYVQHNTNESFVCIFHFLHPLPQKISTCEMPTL